MSLLAISWEGVILTVGLLVGGLVFYLLSSQAVSRSLDESELSGATAGWHGPPARVTPRGWAVAGVVLLVCLAIVIWQVAL